MRQRVRTTAKVPTAYTLLRSEYGVEEFLLKKNGLRVLHIVNNNAPVVGLMVTYYVGSKHDPKGGTGQAHILEHLMFKGSKKFPPKRGVSVLELLGKKGALVNASTWVDRTNYYEVFPLEHFEYCVRLEADRMRNAFLRKSDLEEELPAVTSEYAMRVSNSPEALLSDMVWATAFTNHPYRNPTIGWYGDIEKTQVSSLIDMYDTYYHPNNAVITVLGNIERNEALRVIERYFGEHPKSKNPIPRVGIVEPPQEGRRFVEVTRPSTKDIVSVSFKVPETLHSDTPALIVLDSLLGDGKLSYLYTRLVEGKKASGTWTEYMPFHDPSLLSLCATPCKGVSHEDVEKEILKVCEDVAKKQIPKTIIERVIAQIQTTIAFTRDGHYATLSMLNESIASGDWTMFFALPKKLASVTKEDVQRVAKKYLTKEAMTVGYFRAREYHI